MYIYIYIYIIHTKPPVHPVLPWTPDKAIQLGGARTEWKIFSEACWVELSSLAKATWIFAPWARLLCRGCFHGQAATKAGQDHGDIIAVESLPAGWAVWTEIVRYPMIHYVTAQNSPSPKASWKHPTSSCVTSEHVSGVFPLFQVKTHSFSPEPSMHSKPRWLLFIKFWIWSRMIQFVIW
jgi:hypothetical protein